MPETLNLNYYYGNEADQYSFYRIPKILLTDRRYKGISYVIDSLKNNTTRIGNIKSYTLAALYNVPVTMGQYYTSIVSHDMAHGLLNG